MSEGMHTPWGVAETKQQLYEGVFWVTTSKHGGLLIATAQAKTALSPKARKIGQPWYDFLAFEQEHDMMVVFYEHPEWYPWMETNLTEALAENMLRKHHPNYFTGADPFNEE